MNREILFRGKRTDNGEWVEGCVAKYQPCADEDKIIYGIVPEYASDLYLLEIIPTTRGQYTGLTDKNGKKIFEGDIIKYKDEFLEVRYSDKQARFITVFLNGVYVPNPAVTMAKGKVIGNIHDARAEAEKALKKQKEEE